MKKAVVKKTVKNLLTCIFSGLLVRLEYVVYWLVLIRNESILKRIQLERYLQSMCQSSFVKWTNFDSGQLEIYYF